MDIVPWDSQIRQHCFCDLLLISCWNRPVNLSYQIGDFLDVSLRLQGLPLAEDGSILLLLPKSSYPFLSCTSDLVRKAYIAKHGDLRANERKPLPYPPPQTESRMPDLAYRVLTRAQRPPVVRDLQWRGECSHSTAARLKLLSMSMLKVRHVRTQLQSVVLTVRKS